MKIINRGEVINKFCNYFEKEKVIQTIKDSSTLASIMSPGFFGPTIGYAEAISGKTLKIELYRSEKCDFQKLKNLLKQFEKEEKISVIVEIDY